MSQFDAGGIRDYVHTLWGVFNTFVFVSDYGSIRSFYPAKSYFINIYIL
ncbi:hypothetical protein [Helicobacter typhlonius]|uniref:Uncharacterized protein n=2 Tax=Helicobacter typhlonius TaxID=76936 RepID=A0A0S4PTH1_9HELI|nr:hypothetical protein [Helicobacter typhlonius]CUU39549.1 Hypothetical protein BN2458_PEG0663 [Helicobacter typhlonius]